MQFPISIEFCWYFLEKKHHIHAIHSAPPVYGDVLPLFCFFSPQKIFGCFFRFQPSWLVLPYILQRQHRILNADQSDKCRSDEKRWNGISHRRLLNYSVTEATQWTRGHCRGSFYKPSATHGFNVNCRTKPQSCSFNHSPGFSELRCHSEASRCWESGIFDLQECHREQRKLPSMCLHQSQRRACVQFGRWRLLCCPCWAVWWCPAWIHGIPAFSTVGCMNPDLHTHLYPDAAALKPRR